MPEALASHVQQRRERALRVAHGARMSSTEIVGPIGRVLLDLALPTILKKLARQQGQGSLAWLFDHRVDWEPTQPGSGITPAISQLIS